ncbi:hypothetical protein CC78DRAFT_575662 [Lojkania enalia]|uniref:Uncharacterized protein n=1 Tax=Lojkania enalia TaxID=147567 RepID=A0A9P4KHA1_9PLEO|nr:hypothetical protein CC78DRAFT_575662 [Didymosphaeria enalia]
MAIAPKTLVSYDFLIALISTFSILSMGVMRPAQYTSAAGVFFGEELEGEIDVEAEDDDVFRGWRDREGGFRGLEAGALAAAYDEDCLGVRSY